MRCSILLVVCACGGSPAALPDAALDARADAARDAAPDAPGANLACLGRDPPDPGAVAAIYTPHRPSAVLRGPAEPDLSIGGKVFAVDHYAIAPTVATVELHRTSDDALVGTATAAADGTFAIAVTGPVAGYFVVTATGKLTTRARADVPLASADGALLLVADAAELGRWYTDAGTTLASGARTIVGVARDCDGRALVGSTFAIAPAPTTVTYYDDVAKRWQPTLAASTNGFVLATGAAASITIVPHAGATALPARVVPAQPDELTLAVMSPYR